MNGDDMNKCRIRKTVIFGFCTGMLLAISSGCQTTPEATTKNSIYTVEDETIAVDTQAAGQVLAQLPEHYTQSFTSQGYPLEIDANITVSDAEIMQGSLEQTQQPSESVISHVLFNGENITSETEDNFTTWQITGKEDFVETFSISTASGLNNYGYSNSLLDQYFSIRAVPLSYNQCTEAQKQWIDNLALNVQNVLDELGFHQKIVSANYYEGDYPYANFETVNEINGIKCCSNAITGVKPYVDCSGSVDISEHGINLLSVHSDFVVKNQEESFLMPWENLEKALISLYEQQSLRRLDNAPPISDIELKYMIDSDENGYRFYPVWSFECYSDVFFKNVSVFAINAQNGTLEYMNSDF